MQPDKIVPNPIVTGLFKKGTSWIRLAFVNRLATAISRPTIGRISTGMNIARAKFCMDDIALSLNFISFSSCFLHVSLRNRQWTVFCKEEYKILHFISS